MKASLFLGVASAAMALAGPIRMPLDKRALETEWVVEMVTVTVTAGKENAGVFIEKPTSTIRKTEPIVVEPTSTSVPAPPPAPEPTTSSSAPPPPPPAPEPTTTKIEPQPEPEPEPEPQPEPEPEPTPEQPTTPGPDADYKDTMLYHHDIHRANHSAPALKWDDTLAGYALNTAKGCVFEHDMDQGSGGYGQNLASWGSSGDISGQELEVAAAAVTMQWYNGEVNLYSSYYGMANPPMDSFLQWGHFTQLVWKGTKSVGCATVQCPAGSVLSMNAWYTVCNYNEPGNMADAYGENVGEPKGDRTVTV